MSWLSKRKRPKEEEQHTDPANVQVMFPSDSDSAEQLRILNQFRALGWLTDEEFQTKRAEIINRT